MSWQVLRHLQAPLPGLPCQTVSYPSSLTIKLQLGSDSAVVCNPLSVWLREMTGDATLFVSIDRRWTPEKLPPPWHHLVWQEDERMLEIALKAELLFKLRLIDAKTLGKPPYSGNQAIMAFAQHPDPDLLIREAVFFAFFSSPEQFVRQGIIGNWLTAVGEVVFERGELSRVRKTQSPLINLGYDLLQQIQLLRHSKMDAANIKKHWQTLVGQHSEDLPASYAAIFWAAAVQSLTELGDMEGAAHFLTSQTEALRELLKCLPGMKSDDLLAGMWCHHMGRLAYYRGEMGVALDHFAQEWQFNGRLNEANRSRLQRSCANVLTDLGFLSAAEHLAQQACQAQEHADEAERYKTLGRLAEILLRQGRYAEAEKAFSESWRLQQNQAIPEKAQTPTYLGHIHLLSNDLSGARQWYQSAETILEGRFDPYLCMGRAALFVRNQQLEALKDLWLLHSGPIAQLRGEKVLPKSVIQMARFCVGQIDIHTLREIFEALKKENYWLEACYLLPVLYPEPFGDIECIQAIKSKLQAWNRDALDFCKTTQLVNDHASSDDFSMRLLLADLEQASGDGQWRNARAIRKIYPFKLLGDALP